MLRLRMQTSRVYHLTRFFVVCKTQGTVGQCDNYNIRYGQPMRSFARQPRPTGNTKIVLTETANKLHRQSKSGSDLAVSNEDDVYDNSSDEEASDYTTDEEFSDYESDDEYDDTPQKVYELPKLPSITETIRMFGLQAKKSLGQNFIVDSNVTDTLVRRMGSVQGCTVIEIGPGPGALTRSLITAGADHVVVVEFDRRFEPALQMLSEAAPGKVTIVWSDILKYNWKTGLESVIPREWAADTPAIKLVGNLPFNLSSVLLLRLLRDMDARTGAFAYGRTEMYLVFQREVAARILAEQSDSSRSKLSILAQRSAKLKPCYALPPHLFRPSPKVWSLQLGLIPYIQPPARTSTLCAEAVLDELYKNKKQVLRKSLRGLFTFCTDDRKNQLVDEMLKYADLAPDVRVHNCSQEAIEKLFEKYEAIMAYSEVASAFASSKDHKKKT